MILLDFTSNILRKDILTFYKKEFDMKLLFLGYAVDPSLTSVLSGASVAGNKMQVNVLRELSRYEDIDLKCITVYPVAAFPRDKKLYIPKATIDVVDGVSSLRVPFLNFPVIKQLWQTQAVKHAAKKLADKDTVVFTFNLFPQIGLPMAWLKKKLGCKTFCLLADLPIDDNPNSKNPLRNLLRRIFDQKTRKAIQECDKFAVLNKHAMEIFAPDKPYIVVEGGVEMPQLANIPVPSPKQRKNILYTGALTEYSGVLELIEAMKKVHDPEVVLEIYGGGYLAEHVKQLADATNNVKYCGKVANTEVLKLQREAYLLVNPRPVDDPIAQVTFPSKMFEYMLSGTPVLTTRLNGLDEEYLERVFSVPDHSADALAKGINMVLSADPASLLEKAVAASDFISREKNWKTQCEKIYHFLDT